jgi:Flp pilus assembly protein TadD
MVNNPTFIRASSWPLPIKTDNSKNYHDVLYMLGYALAWAGEKDEAEKYLIEATELDPTDYRAFYSLGYVYRDTSRYERAKEAWAKVLKLFPNFPEVGNNIRSIEKLI